MIARTFLEVLDSLMSESTSRVVIEGQKREPFANPSQPQVQQVEGSSLGSQTQGVIKWEKSLNKLLKQ
jgi:hypothetical protein